MSAVFERQTGVKFFRSVKHVKIRVRDVMPALTTEDVAKALATVGRRSTDEYCRSFPSRYRSVWARLPLSATKRVVNAGKVQVGWFVLPVESLKARRM